MLWGLVQTHRTTLNGSHAMVNDLDARVLLVVESSVEGVAIDKHIDTSALEIFEFIDFQVRIANL